MRAQQEQTAQEETSSNDAAAVLRWARTSQSSALSVVSLSGFVLRYPLFDRLDAETQGGLRWLTGSHSEERYPGLAALALRESQELLRSGRQRLCSRFEIESGRGALEVRIERLLRRGGEVAILIAHPAQARASKRNLPELSEAAQHEDRMQAVGMVASGVAHELNHSLNVIALRLARLRQDPALASARPHFESLERVAGDAAATVARLQDLVRRRRDVPSGALELGPVIDAAVESARVLLEEARRLGRDAAPTAKVRIDAELPRLPPVRGSATELGHVFLDLILTARDAMPLGGVVRVRTRLEGERVIATVEDEGRGVPEHHLLRVFDPFYSLSETRDTGPGLSIAAGVMSRLGGTIEVHNRSSGGSIYTLSFPVVKGEARSTLPEPPRPSRSLRVLLVDDEADNLELLAEVLAADGHQVACAQSGRAALELLRGDTGFDLVLCDVGMPGMSGWQLVREAKALQPGLCIYMLTGWANEFAADDARKELVRGVLGKPIELDQLRWLLARISREAQAARATEATET